jgi:hypothetical protein
MMSFAQRPTSIDVTRAGFTEQEFFLSGTASSFAAAAGTSLTADGRWSTVPAASAPFTTRMLVERPADPRRFNGTVVVEWLNVSAQLELAPDFGYAHEELLRAGFAWVGVSAQQLGVNQPQFGLKTWDPVRYGALSHPGDSFSYDIFSQAGRAVRGESAGPRPLGTLHPRLVLADGESQSASRMAAYVDGVAPSARVFDGFMIHSRGQGTAPLSQAPQPLVTTPSPTLIRTDLRTPVLQFETETDVPTTGLSFAPARQPDTDRLRTWEVAGTSHADQFSSDGLLPITLRDNPGLPPSTCDKPFNAGTAEHWVMNDAVAGLRLWAAGGPAPAHAPPLRLTSDNRTLLTDQHGNGLGGIRTPAVDVPVATLTGLGNTGAGLFCFLDGTTTPFTAQQLAALYPRRVDYAGRVAIDVARAVDRRFLLPADARTIARAAVRCGPIAC